MKKVYLIRHGLPDFPGGKGMCIGTTDIPMGEKGFRQAAEMGYEAYDGKHLTVEPVSTAEYGVSKAERPSNSRLNKIKLTEQGFELLPSWKDALARYLKEIAPF